MDQITQLMDELGYRFKNTQLLQLALRHPSLGPNNNQRLEFLGDAVLQLAISQRLYTGHPELHEGTMTVMRQRLVCEQALADVARSIHLGQYLSMDHGSDATGVRKQSGPLSDAMEAVLAAVYLDGGFESAYGIVARLWPEKISLAEDSKSQLQEYEQAKGNPPPAYALIGEEGPDHARIFTVRVSTCDGFSAVGSGHTKKSAEQSSAANLLSSLQRELNK